MASPQTDEELRAVFKDFDMNGDGIISVTELQHMSKKLGMDLTNKEFAHLMTTLDTNCDGKIQFEEFKDWWHNRRDSKMSSLVSLKMKMKKMAKRVRNNFKQSKVSLKNYQGSNKADNHNICIQCGDCKPEGMSMEFNLYNQGPDYHSLYEQLSKAMPNFNPNSTNFMIKVPTKDSSALKSSIEKCSKNMVQLMLNMEMQDNPFFSLSFKEQSNCLIIAIHLKDQLQMVADQGQQPIEKMMKILGDSFFCKTNVTFKTNFSIMDLLSKNLVECLMQGFKLDFHMEMTSEAMKKLKQFAENSMDAPSQFFLWILIRKSRMNLKMKSPENLSKFFSKLGIQQLVQQCPQLEELIDIGSTMIEQMKQGDQFSPLFEMLEHCMKNVNPGIEVTMIKTMMAARLTINCKDVNQIYQRLFDVKL